MTKRVSSEIRIDPQLLKIETYAAFTQAGLITRKRTKSFYKSIFVLSRLRDI